MILVEGWEIIEGYDHKIISECESIQLTGIYLRDQDDIVLAELLANGNWHDYINNVDWTDITISERLNRD